MREYVHGYAVRENERLYDQAGTLAELLHHDTIYAPGEHVLEAGCGVGAQTRILTRQNPETHFTSIDMSERSIEQARETVGGNGFSNVTFHVADILDLPFEEASFDHVFVCFVLEHLSDPIEAIGRLRRVLKPGGTFTAIEGDHGSTFFHPHSSAAWKTIQCLIDFQAEIGGDALIGRRLHSVLSDAGLSDARISPRFVYADASRPEWIDGFTRKTFIAMVESVRDQAIDTGRMSPDEWEQGIADMERTTESDGAFCYTFFKGVAVNQ